MDRKHSESLSLDIKTERQKPYRPEVMRPKDRKRSGELPSSIRRVQSHKLRKFCDFVSKRHLVKFSQFSTFRDLEKVFRHREQVKNLEFFSFVLHLENFQSDS